MFAGSSRGGRVEVCAPWIPSWKSARPPLASPQKHTVLRSPHIFRPPVHLATSGLNARFTLPFWGILKVCLLASVRKLRIVVRLHRPRKICLAHTAVCKAVVPLYCTVLPTHTSKRRQIS